MKYDKAALEKLVSTNRWIKQIGTVLQPIFIILML